ncbi:transposase domain-containing protein [Ferrovum sp.]|uniref:transposase domain-containing protein n=1 Tax=Ferrovum sp. TaxID=2609467 RepID=UPI00387E5F94
MPSRLPCQRRTPFRYKNKILCRVWPLFEPTGIFHAKLNDMDPFDWLKDTLEKLPTWPNSTAFRPNGSTSRSSEISNGSLPTSCSS